MNVICIIGIYILSPYHSEKVVFYQWEYQRVNAVQRSLFILRIVCIIQLHRVGKNKNIWGSKARGKQICCCILKCY
jgi:hypothetical protein